MSDHRERSETREEAQLTLRAGQSTYATKDSAQDECAAERGLGDAAVLSWQGLKVLTIRVSCVNGL